MDMFLLHTIGTAGSYSFPLLEKRKREVFNESDQELRGLGFAFAFAL